MGASEASGGSHTLPYGVCRRMIHAAKIHRDVRLHAKAQATPPQPSPTVAGEGAILAKMDFQAALDL